jgi:hypothetical protein
LAVVLLVGLGATGLWVYLASQHVPEFYRQSLEVDLRVSRKASDEMLQRTADLASDLRKDGHWQVVFTEAQLNGWLAVDRVENHPNAVPAEITDPRVHIEGSTLVVACRYRSGRVNSVVSLTLEPYLVRPNLLAVRVRKARAGRLPLPLNRILDAISEGVRRSNFHIEWRQADSDPVAQISPPPPRDKGNVVQIDAFRIADGKIVVAGSTRKK